MKKRRDVEGVKRYFQISVFLLRNSIKLIENELMVLKFSIVDEDTQRDGVNGLKKNLESTNKSIDSNKLCKLIH